MGKTKNIRDDGKNEYIVPYVAMAIDPGITPGWGVVQHSNNGLKLIAYGKIPTTPKAPIEERLDYIALCLDQIISAHQPDIIHIEELNTSFGRKKGGRTINRRDLQVYSAAWGTIWTTLLYTNDLNFERQPNIKLVKIKNKPSKKMARAFVKHEFDIGKISDDAAEAVTWACATAFC